MLAGTVVNRVGSFVAPFLVLYLTGERGLSASTAGLALAAYGLGGLIATPVAGWAADHLGRRITMVTCMLGAAASLLALGAARAPWVIVLTCVIAGGTAEGFRPAVNAIVADIVPPAERPRAFAMIFWGVNLGFSVATLTGGALAAQGWWTLFLVDAATCAVFGLLILVRVPETRPERVEGDPVGTFGEVLRDRLLLVMAGLFLVEGILLFQAFSTLPLAMRADGLTTTEFGLVIAVNGLAIVALQPLVAGRLGRMRPGRVLAGSMLVMGGGLWATAVATSVPAYGVTVLLWTFGEIGFAAVAMSAVASLAPPHMRGRYTSVTVGAAGIAVTLGPLAGTVVYEGYGEDVVWAACGVLGALGLAVGLVVDRPLRRRLGLSPGTRRSA